MYCTFICLLPVSSLFHLSILRLITFYVLIHISFLILYLYHVFFHVVATRPCYTFHLPFSFLYFLYFTCSYPFRVLYFVLSIYCIHVLFISYTVFLLYFSYDSHILYFSSYTVILYFTSCSCNCLYFHIHLYILILSIIYFVLSYTFCALEVPVGTTEINQIQEYP